MKLIEFDGLDFKLADEAFFFRPIRDLYRKDRSVRKEEFWKQISYLWFMCDPRSPYMYLVDEKSRADEIIRQEGLPKGYEPSPLLKEAMDMYRSQATTSASLLLESMRKGIENVRKFLAEVDLFAVDEKTQKPLYQVSTITAALKQVPELAKALSDAERSLSKDFEQEDKARGSVQAAAGEGM